MAYSYDELQGSEQSQEDHPDNSMNYKQMASNTPVVNYSMVNKHFGNEVDLGNDLKEALDTIRNRNLNSNNTWKLKGTTK